MYIHPFYIFIFICITARAVSGSLCNGQFMGTKVSEANRKEMPESTHIFLNQKFWKRFVYDVEERKAWKLAFSSKVLYENFEKDAQLYSSDKVQIFKDRRLGVTKWLQNDTEWIRTIIGACKEIASDQKGLYTQELEKYHLVEALKDFVDHVHYFYLVASIMKSRGEKVIVFSPNSSSIHDIDKLDPIMLVGYSELFTDGKNTSVWNLCVNSHTHTNPHHQIHCLWQDCCGVSCGSSCDSLGDIAVREMVCDKVSRRLQKNLNGTVSDEMWDVEMIYYNGLPSRWLTKAEKLQQRMKNWKN